MTVFSFLGGVVIISVLAAVIAVVAAVSGATAAIANDMAEIEK